VRNPLLTIGAVAVAAVVVAADPPKLGPEWTYEKEMKRYTKTMPIKVTRSAGGNTQGYFLDLRDDKVLVYDTDENTSTGVRVNDTIDLEIWKNRKRGSNSVTVGLAKCVYHDLDRDGVWDSWYDGRGGSDKCYIRRDGAWVQVCDSKGGLVGDGPELSIDRKTEYTWDGKNWISRPVDR